VVPVRLARWWSRQFTDAWQDKKHQKKVAAEFIGTLLFTFLAGAAAVNAESSGLVTGALGGGLAFAVMVYATAGDNGSGGKLNPAITAGLLITGRCDRITAAWEMLAQFVGGLIGGILLKISIPHTDLTVPLLAMGGPSTNHPLSTFIWEYMATAFLVLTVFATVVDKQSRHADSGVKVTLPAPFAPLAIGLAVVVGAFAAGPFTGGAMNPARALGPAIAFWNFKNIWVYILATFMGGMSGAVIYENLFLEMQPPEPLEASEASV
jgi:aquaporin TIP